MDEDGDGELDFQEFQEGLKTIDNKLLPIKIGYEKVSNLSFSETLMMIGFILLLYFFDEISN